MNWEYLVEGFPIPSSQGIGIVRSNAMTPQNHVQNHLNARGGEGWELVQFLAAAGQVACDIYAPGVMFVFKRPRP